MHGKAIFELVAARFSEAVFDLSAGAAGDAVFKVKATDLVPVMAFLRDDPSLRLDFLQNLTAIDWIERQTFEIVYHLFSYQHRHGACVKTDIPRAEPRIPSLASLWKSANWLEREQYDLLGVVFDGHPDLRRLLLPDDWVGHPMRKDYAEASEYRGMPTTRPSPMDLILQYDKAHPKKAPSS